MEWSGLASYAVYFFTFVGIYGVLALGLNIQWGLAGLFNIGIAAFFAVGAYTSALLTTAPSSDHLGGYGLPIPLGMVAAMAIAGVLAWAVGRLTVNLRDDYLAIATIGIAEIVRLVLKNEDWATNGVRGVFAIPQPFQDAIASGRLRQAVYLAVVVVVVAGVYWACERARRSPWGRVLRAIREREIAALAAGKDVAKFRLQALVLGAMIMGLGGALYAHSAQFIVPGAFEPVAGTFLVWVMLIAGGSGNNRGALLGAAVVWVIWSATEILASRMPAEFATQASAARLALIGVLVIVILLWQPDGLLPEPRAGAGDGAPQPDEGREARPSPPP